MCVVAPPTFLSGFDLHLFRPVFPARLCSGLHRVSGHWGITTNATTVQTSFRRGVVGILI